MAQRVSNTLILVLFEDDDVMVSERGRSTSSTRAVPFLEGIVGIRIKWRRENSKEDDDLIDRNERPNASQ